MAGGGGPEKRPRCQAIKKHEDARQDGDGNWHWEYRCANGAREDSAFCSQHAYLEEVVRRVDWKEAERS